MPSTVFMSDYDLPTRSASGFVLRYIAPRLGPVHLHWLLARRLPFRLAAPPSDIIIGVGHGDADAFTGQNQDVILEVSSYHRREVEGKVIKLLACESGLRLGPDLVRNGALSFAGYGDDYLWIMDADLSHTPWADDMAAANLIPVIDGINALLDGKTSREAYDIELNGYARNIEAEEDELIKSCLEFDCANAIILGSRDAKVRARPKISFPIPPPPLLIPLKA